MNTMTKKGISIAISLMLIVTMFSGLAINSGGVYAAGNDMTRNSSNYHKVKKYKGFKYFEEYGHTITILNYVGKKKTITIPNTIERKKVKHVRIANKKVKTIKFKKKNNIAGLFLEKMPKLKKISTARLKKLNEVEIFKCGVIKLNTKNNKKLTSITISGCNNLTSINTTGNKILYVLSISKCKSINSINVTQNKYLDSLSIGYTNITTLNISENTELGQLYCYNSKLTHLDISKNTNLWDVDITHTKGLSLETNSNHKFELTYSPTEGAEQVIQVEGGKTYKNWG